ncbi:hypothetical protein [Chromobacterium subtsugae]|uniref:hypothetical protein n=1 Tax=Chromobacterium subtsugae TaxID=251747 RepID=UPI0007F8B7CB|nr:hypothetical protein [Chromobacterium subtsugae]OBU85461.1 hypothetical protein MY55_15870 [Chromobacterium subtsugae]
MPKIDITIHADLACVRPRTIATRTEMEVRIEGVALEDLLQSVSADDLVRLIGTDEIIAAVGRVRNADLLLRKERKAA